MSGIFTTIRIVRGHPWFLDDHLARLCGRVGRREILRAAAGLRDARMRVTLLPGQPPHIEVAAYAPPSVPWVLHPVLADPPDRVRRKIVDRTLYRTARLAAPDADDALLHLADGRLLECTVANVFLVRDGRLATPPGSLPLLAGIARRRVMAAAAELGLPVAEEPLTLADAARAEECFVTNALFVAHPVGRIGGNEKPVVGGLAPRLHEVVCAKGL